MGDVLIFVVIRLLSTYLVFGFRGMNRGVPYMDF